MKRIVFEFNEGTIKQELFEVQSADMLTAAALLVVQVAEFEFKGNVTTALKVLAKGYVEEVLNQKKMIPVNEKGKALNEEGAEAIEEFERKRDMDLDAQETEGELKREKRNEQDNDQS